MSPAITYELGGSAGDNIRAIQKNAEAYTGGSSGGGSASGGEGGGKKLIIENLYVRNGKISVSAKGLGGEKLGADLPTIHLKDIGKKKGGATPGEVASQVIGALNASIQKTVSGLGLDKLKGAVGGAVKGITEGVGGGADGAGKAIGGAAKDAEGAVKKLFGN